MDSAGLVESAAAAFDRRREPVQALAADAEAIAATCSAMASRFLAGGRLLVFGAGGAATDAEHIAVEFVHPVIVGKRALPAMSLASDAPTLTGIAAFRDPAEIFSHQLATLGRPDDIAIGLAADGDDVALCHGLAQARAAGLLTIALVGGGASRTPRAATLADHALITPSGDPHIVKECQVTAYHVLWELVHVFFDNAQADPEQAPVAGGVEALYPFLYGGSHAADEVVASVAASTVAKVTEVIELRAAAGRQLADRLAAAAIELAAALDAGATLWAFGNGGSSTDAQAVVHAYVNPTAGFRALPAFGLTSEVAVVTALSNDVGFDVVFARQLRAFGRAADVAVGLSTSGGSANVLAAFDEAKAMGMTTVGLAGYGGGRMAQATSIDHLFAVESASVHRVQEVQTTVYHVLWELTQIALAAGGL